MVFLDVDALQAGNFVHIILPQGFCTPHAKHALQPSPVGFVFVSSQEPFEPSEGSSKFLFASRGPAFATSNLPLEEALAGSGDPWPQQPPWPKQLIWPKQPNFLSASPD